MKRMMCVRIAAFVTFGLMSYGATPVESAAPKPYADRQVIVKLKRGLLKTEGDEIRGELRSKTKCRFKLIDAELWEISGMTVEKAIEKYRNDPRIEYIEPNYTVTALDVIPNDPSFPLLWGMHNTGQSGGTPDADIDAPEAWGIQTGTDVIIGIIDTGVDRTHPDLAANMWTNPGEIAGNGIDDDGNGYVDDVRGWDFVNNDNDPMDDHGHGTHCAGTIAGIGDNGIGVAGVCWHARIMALKFLDAGGYGSTSDAVLALEYATANGARLTSNSWGGGNYSTALYDAIAAARNVGALFIAAAGNDGVNNDSYPHYPSSYDLDNIIAVAATDRNDALANFSCYGAASVDLGAPGVDIYSSLPGSSYGYKSGTSMATPHVSGAVALVWSEYPTASFAIVKARMLASVDALAVLKGKTVSGGRLNVFKLLAEPDSIPPAAVGDVAVGDTASNAVTLVLTATGDDGTTGRASAYDVRYSLSPIDSNNFDSADQASGEPRPAPAGSQDTIEVRGLNFNSTYYFALKVQDEWGNESPLSNVTYATTLGVPHMAVGPDSLADSLLTGAISKRSIAIENTEPRSTLDFCVSIEGVGVSVSPACGTVSGPAIANVEVTFDAAGLYGGDYSTRILIAGNDTTNSVDTIIALLHVTGASDIAVSDTLLDYGPVFLGGVAADTVTVRNEGTDTLRVNGISTDNADFTVDATPFVLGIGGRRDLIVTFGPSEIGLRAGTLTILSDDPDEGEVDVALRGEGLEPPVISVAPDSLADSLLTGQTSTHQLTISNTGASDLSYSIMMQGGVAGEAFSPVENQPIMGSREATPNETNPTTDPIKVEAVYSGAYLLFGISSYGEIMPYQFPVGNEHLMVGAYAAGYTVAYRSGGVDHVCYAAYSSRVGIVPVSYTELVNDPALVVVEVVTETTDLLMKITQRFTFVRADKYIRIETTLRNLSGGRLDDVVFKSFADWDMDGTSSGDNWNYDIGRHMVYAWEGTYAAIGGNRAPDYMDIDGWNDYSRRTTTVGYPEGPVLNYDGLEILHYEMGNLDAGASTGLVTAYAAGDDLIDLRLRMMRASIGWLSVTPAVGTVPAGGNATVDVTFDAMRMYGGNYDSDVVIVNNDPLHPKVRVPAHLHVTGAPDIAVSDTLIDFGIVWVGHGDVDTLVISNEGTDTLFVSGIEASSERFGVDSAAFALAPNDSRPVSLTCNAIATGITEGVLTISSNDPDEDTLLVSVRFEATLPPEMQISPASLAAGLHTGESLERVLTIENGGGDDLVFAVTERDAADGGSTGLAILMLYGDYTSPKDMRDSLSAFPDIERVDVFNAWYGTPSLGTLLGYDCVIVMNSYQYKDRWTLGDALADYVDRGGGVVLAHGTFVGYYAVAGRFGSGGYYPFNLGTRYRAQANLGDYDHGNPIMAGVTSAHTNSPAEVTIAAGAVWVATWSTGIPFVATKGEHVVGANISLDNVSQNEWSGDIPRLIHNAVLWASGGGGICWAREAPASGVVAPLGSAEVAVTFNPRSRCAPGGSFDDTLVVSSNAPAAPSVRVPLHLDVIATPDIAVGDTLLDFGPVLVGNAAERTIVVANYGAAVLSVSAFTVDNPVFTSSPSSFSLAVNEERVFTVVFEPVASGLIEGTLTIASNDPDQPVVGVAVRGQALMPPAISVIPDSLNASLMRGDSLVRIVEIRNDGVADLEWSIYPLDGGDVGSFTLPPAQEPDGKPSPDEGIVMERAEGVRVESGELTAALADLAGVRVLYDYAHSQYSDTYWWSTLIADLKARGATVEMNRVPITPAVLAGCNVYWITDVQAPFTASEIVALRDWVEAGGGLLLEGDQSADAWNAVLAGMGAGIEYSSIAGTKGVTTQIRPHVTTLGVSSVLLYNNVGHLSSVSYPARLLLNDMAGLANAAHSVAGKGRIVAFADEPFENDYIVQQDNRVFGNQIMDWLVHGANWLNTMPLQGTVPGGDTAAVAVTIDPRGLYGGGYDARLHITSNVPSTPEVTVPVHASVTGIPALAVSDTTLDFGDVLIGATEPRTLVATNVGTDLLVVSGFRLSGAGFAADTSGVTLAVHGTDTLIVTLTPPVEGPMSGLLTICTNDPADTARTIELTGNGLVPPQIVVSPGALSDTLYTGGVSSHILEIENPGEHDLNFTIGENGSGNRILFITAGADVSFVRSALLAYSDVSAVDVFNGGAGTPSLGYLLSYRCVIVAGGPCADPVAAGNVLADYADRGGGVILTFASHMSGIALQGRIMGAGYSPFTVAPGISTNGTLGTYETGHPIMAGIDWMQSLVYSATSLVPGAHLVAAWSDGVPAVATMGNHVVGANVFTVNNGSSPGLNTIVIARLLCNAMLWMSGGNICWMDAQPSAGAVSPHASAQVTVTFSMRNEPVCITEGDYLDTLVVETNVPTMPRVNVPLHLFAIAAPDVVAADSVPDFGAVMLGSTAAETLIVANAGVNPLVVSAITSDHPSFTADPGAFSLAPNASRIVTIRFAPVDPGAARGTLTIASNDPDEAQTHAVLAGYGLSNVSLVSPHGGESWTVGEPDTIRWTVTGPEPDSVTVLLSRDGGVSFADTLASGIAGAISYAWVVEPPPTTEASIMIRSYRGGAVSGCDASDSLFAIVVTTGVDDGDALPAVNALAQNCPNPFNPVTRIDFSLRMSGPVSLRIYDSAGRLVRVLIDEPRNAGRHSAIWDGKDAGGRLAASGVYYCRITAGSFSATRKMILLR
jgi:subtilisin family serine protease